eukprot:UN4706
MHAGNNANHNSHASRQDEVCSTSGPHIIKMAPAAISCCCQGCARKHVKTRFESSQCETPLPTCPILHPHRRPLNHNHYVRTGRAHSCHSPTPMPRSCSNWTRSSPLTHGLDVSTPHIASA